MPDWLREILDWIAVNMEAAALIGGGLVVAMGYVTGFFKWLAKFLERKPKDEPPAEPTGPTSSTRLETTDSPPRPFPVE